MPNNLELTFLKKKLDFTLFTISEVFNFTGSRAVNLRSEAYYRWPLIHFTQYETDSITNLEGKNGT